MEIDREIGSITPTIHRSADQRRPGELSSIESVLSERLAGVLDARAVDRDAHLFDDLGADSLTVASFCARVRAADDVPNVSIKEVYQHPTVAALADYLEARAEEIGDLVADAEESDEPEVEDRPASSLAYWLCGVAQFTVFLGFAALGAVLVRVSYDLVAPASGVGETYLRSLAVGAGFFAALTVIPLAVKWIVIGRWKPRRIRLWSPAYLRFWVGRSATLANPLRVFVGSPIYPVYLRLLGAKVGRGTVIFSRRVPVCTDLLTIGDAAVVREDAVLSCYRAKGHHLELGPVEVGERAFVGHGTVLDIWTRVGRGSQIGHSSALSPGQSVPDGARMIGTPATTTTEFDFVDVAPCDRSRLRRVGYGLLVTAMLFLVAIPTIMGLTVAFIEWRSANPPTGAVLSLGGIDLSPSRVLIVAAVMFVGILQLRLFLAVAAGRLSSRLVRADEVYPLFGLRYLGHRIVQRLTNVAFFNWMFGDSSYIVHYTKAIGYDVSFEDQTGANFGLRVRHDNPSLISVGPGTMAADDLVLVNTDYSATSFRLSRVEIGGHSFFGNYVTYPAAATTGENCLHASKVRAPLEGPVREHAGFLGSPSFEIPRSVYRDREFEAIRGSADFPERLSAKNRHNVGSMALLLAVRFVALVGAITLGFAIADVFADSATQAVFVGSLTAAVLGPLYRVVVERAAIGFGRLQPANCSIYDLETWEIERYWKLIWMPKVFNGTPFKGVIWRLMGARVGRRLFDDGCTMMEKTMVTLGDDCVLNANSVIQPHSLEDGAFKSDLVEIGSGCTLGVGGLVHYGSRMGDGSSLEANAFLMKGTETPDGTAWGENPARELEVVPAKPAAWPLGSAATDDHATIDEHSSDEKGAGGDMPDGNGSTAAPVTRESGGARERTRAATAADTRYWQEALLAGGFTPIPRWSGGPDGEQSTNVALTRDLARDLDEVARHHDASVGSLLLTAHARVVASLTGEKDVVVGAVVDVDADVLPCRLTVEDSWQDVVGAAAGRIRDIEAHRHVDLAAVRSELNLTAPLFETAVDLTGGTPELPPDVAFLVSLRRGVGGSRLHVRFSTADFDDETATRIALYHLRALEALAADPETPVSEQSLLSSEEVDHQVHGLAGRARELPDRRFHRLFEDRVTAHPDAVAGRFRGEEWTYTHLNERANQVAHTLVDAGVGREDVVAVVTERNLDWMASVIGVFKAGAVYLPIEPHFPAGRIEKTLARAECRWVITESGSTETLDDALASLPEVNRLLCEDVFTHDDRSNPDIEVDLDQLAYIYFTSGSTGEPKGAMCEHAGMLNHLYAKLDDLGAREGEVVAQIAPQCFDISLWQLVAPLLVGGCTLIVDQDTILRPERFIDLIVESEVGVMQVVPSYLEVLLTYLDQHPRALGSLHSISATGEALTLELAQRWFAAQPDITLVNAYGLTETSDDTNHEVMTEAPVGSVPLGPPISNAFVYVLDEHLAPVPLGAPGEICFSGICVGRGYINDPERTAQAYLDDPLRPGERLYRSGDFGRWRPDGKLEYLGRRDAQVKIRGFRIEIGEIENTLAQADGVRHAAVVITGSDDATKQLVAFYAGDERPASELRDHLARALPEYMVPSAIHWRDALPLTGNGKIDRRTLRALAEDMEAGGAPFEPLQTPTEHLLAGHWARILGLPEAEVGRRDHFFDQGGSSLSAVELVIALEDEISLKDVTRAPVLADLARVLDGESIGRQGLLQPLSVAGAGGRAALVCVPYAGGNAVNFQALAASLRGTGIDVHAVELPGHQLTESEDDLAPLGEIAEALVAEIGDLGSTPVALWGHSAGSALAIEAAQRLSAAGRDPQAVFIGAHALGDVAQRRRHLDELSGTSDRKLVTVLTADSGYGDIGGLDADQVAHLGAALRHDVVGTHRYFLDRLEAVGNGAKLDVPVVVVAADDDAATPPERSDGWEQLADEVEVRRLDTGGHFFIRTEPDRTAAIVREALLGEVVDPAEPAPAPSAARRERSAVDLRASTVAVELRDGVPPLVSVADDPHPAQWAAAHRDRLRDEVTEHGALLVRGLSLEGAGDFLAVAHVLANGLADDTEAFAPREHLLGQVYSSSAWPANQQMCMHHELSYRQTVPGLMLFGCLEAPTSGGAIPLADASAVLEALPGDLVTEFETRGWMLRRAYTEDIGLSAAEAFGIDDRDAIGKYCQENGIEAEWQGDVLATRQRRPAVTEHPVTGKRCWFNQIAFLNEWTMKPEVRDFLISTYGEEGLPFTTLFGDGEPIGADVVETINAAYDSVAIREPLETHDLLLVDNLATAHSREPYEGSREVVVALGDPQVVHIDLAPAAARRSRRTKLGRRS